MLRTIVLSPGECAVLASNSTVTSVILDGDAQISSTSCTNLPEPGVYACWLFFWEAPTGAPLDDAIFSQLIIGSNSYNVPIAYADYDNELPAPVGAYELYLSGWIDTDPAFTGLVKFGCDTVDGLQRALKIRIPEGLPAPKLKITNPTSGDNAIMYIEAVEDSDCDTCN